MITTLRVTGMVLGALAALGCGGNTDESGGACPSCSEPRWACLGKPATRNGSGSREVELRLRNFVSLTPPPSTTVKVCSALDTACEHGEPRDGLVSGTNGAVTVELAADGSQMVQIVGRDGSLPPGDRPLDTYYYDFNPPGSVPTTIEVRTIPRGVHASLAQLEPDPPPDLAMVLLTARSCDGAPAAGVRFRMEPADPITRAFYSPDAPDPDTTDARGVAGFMNVEPGPVRITGEIARTGELIGNVDLLVRPSTLTVSNVVPGVE